MNVDKPLSPDLAAPADAFGTLPTQLQDMEAAIASHFDHLRAGAISSLLDDPDQAGQAYETGAFPIDGRLVVMRLNAEDDTIELFVDLGLPLHHRQEQAYRRLLEMNLCRTHPGITFGLHPDSGRMVATVAVHAFMVADVQSCISILRRLANLSSQLEESGELHLA